MRPTDGTRHVAEEIARRRRRGQDPMVLLLGTGCARAAGVPAIHEIAREVFAGLRPSEDDEPEETATGIALPSADAGDEELTEKFYEQLGRMTPLQRAALMVHFSTSVPVPQFYQDLAVLVRRGYFRTILTTNIDALLERALLGAGLRREQDFVIHMTSDEKPPQGDDDGKVALLKLHGDAQGNFAITPEEIVEFVRSQRRLVKEELRDDTVMVGYELECPPLTGWLARMPDELWWVAPQPLDGPEVDEIAGRRDIKWVTGESVGPAAFFAELSMLLMHMPAVNAMRQSLKGFRAARSGSAPDLAALETRAPDDPEAFEREYVRGQLRRCLDALRRLEQEALPGDVDERLERQISYQRHELARLEARLRGLQSSRKKIHALLASVQEEAQSRRDRADVAGAMSHLAALVDAVEGEYGGPAPNEHVVSSSLGGISILAERIGVPPTIVGELASFVPSTLRSQL